VSTARAHEARMRPQFQDWKTAIGNCVESDMHERASACVERRVLGERPAACAIVDCCNVQEKDKIRSTSNRRIAVLQ